MTGLFIRAQRLGGGGFGSRNSQETPFPVGCLNLILSVSKLRYEQTQRSGSQGFSLFFLEKRKIKTNFENKMCA